MILLDTNAVIYYLQNDPTAVKAIDRLRSHGEDVSISAITETEALGFPDITATALLDITRWLEEIHSIPVNSSLARHAAHLRREYHLKTPDAIIAATALSFDATLITRDKGFKKIEGLRIVRC